MSRFTEENEEMLDEMMRLDAEHDPEMAREQLMEQLATAAWEASEEYVTSGEKFEIVESEVLTPDFGEDDYTWTLVYRETSEGDVFEVVNPDGDVMGTMPIRDDDPREQMNELSQFAELYHRDRLVEEFHEQREAEELEVGDTFLLGIARKFVVREIGIDDHCEIAIYGPEGDVALVIAGEDLETSTITRVVEEWRDGIENKYSMGDA